MQAFSHWQLVAAWLTGRGVWSEGRGAGKRAIPLERDPTEGSFSSMSGLQRPLCVAMRHAAPSSHSGAPLRGAGTWFLLGPRGSLKASRGKVSIMSSSRAPTINSGPPSLVRQRWSNKVERFDAGWPVNIKTRFRLINICRICYLLNIRLINCWLNNIKNLDVLSWFQEIVTLHWRFYITIQSPNNVELRSKQVQMLLLNK